MNGQIISDRYEIIEKIGEGGFGTTYLARDRGMPSLRYCVIKQLKPLEDDPKIYEQIGRRFQKEAALLEDFGEHNRQIPKLYAYREGGGQFYLVQEYIDGDTLTAKLKNNGPLNSSTVRDILIKLLPVLSYIHDRGIVHRDIKPDNIIWRNSDSLPVLIDFGAVKEIMKTGVAPTNPISSIVIGTLDFMPSEQTLGRPVFATDIYSLGLTAIYLLTGKLPRELDTDSLTGEFRWRHLVPDINPDLAAILDKAVKPHPQDRFTTANAMLSALKASKDSKTAAVVNEDHTRAVISPTPVLEGASGSNPSKWIIIGGIIAFLGIIGILFLNYLQQQRIEARKAEIRSPDPSPIITPTPEPSPVITPTPEPSPVVTPTPEPSPIVTPTPVVTPTPEPSPVVTPEPEPSPPVGRVAPSPSPVVPEPNPPNNATLSESDAIGTVRNFYDLVSTRQYQKAGRIFSDIQPKFFDSFDRVTIEDLRVTGTGDNSIDLIGENTYYYPDGSTQRESRSFTVTLVDGEPKITDSRFIRVIRFRG